MPRAPTLLTNRVFEKLATKIFRISDPVSVSVKCCCDMNFTFLFIFLTVVTLGSPLADNLDDISFDDDEPAAPGLDDLSDNEENSSSLFAKTEAERRAMLKKVLGAAFKKPGAKTRLGQVLPIVRLMTPPQRLALASLVMAQVLADPQDPLPPVSDSKNLTSQLMLPISMDIATMFRGMGKEAQEKEKEVKNEVKSEARSTSYLSGLYGPHRAALGPNIRRPPPTLNGISRRNANNPMVVMEKQGLMPKRRPSWSGPKMSPRTIANITTKKPSVASSSCTSMNNNLCMELNDYPEEAILKSLKRETNKDIFKILTNEPSQLKEGEQKPKLLERRQGEGEGNKKQMCTSTLEYARPKKARATSGQWKFIVNTGDYTQTLRLELCSQPHSQCLFLAEDIDSTCEQVFNYHRLLTWDESAGLTMDVFKVPTCCSCKVLGYGGMSFSTTGAPPFTPVDHPDTNLVANDEPPVIRLPPPPLPPPSNTNNKQGIRVRPYSPPKRRPTVHHRGPPLPLEGETIATDDSRYPPFDNNLRRITRNNTVDRIHYNPHLLMPPSPNNRHPALPIDSIHSESIPANSFTSPSNTFTAPTNTYTVTTNTFAAPTNTFSTPENTYVTPTVTFTAPPPTSTEKRPSVEVPSQSSSPTKRINYSYHPIIDYFRPQILQRSCVTVSGTHRIRESQKSDCIPSTSPRLKTAEGSRCFPHYRHNGGLD
ncbi:hypothetical protein GE061_019924 [Apolygus lucorum]|uniref:Spaetzle domain-containing protein n=1 Tax=Apolygus lucorum TaxID=248454 RepID=A0A8S9XBS7_APOLU|nr:hypothetical protein GE061_019924 [Apolygus lucorum]